MIEPLKKISNNWGGWKLLVEDAEDKINELIEAVNKLTPEEPKECNHEWAEVSGTAKEYYKWCTKCSKRVDLEPKPEKLADVIKGAFKTITFSDDSIYEKQATAAIDFIESKLPKEQWSTGSLASVDWVSGFHACLCQIKEIIARMR